jgi:hypothetical protein
MITLPDFVSYTAVADFMATGTPKTVSPAVKVGDRIVVCGVTEDSTYTMTTPSDGVNTYTQAQQLAPASYTRVAIWTATAATAATLTISIDRGGGDPHWGFGVLVFRGSDGFGASNSTNVSSGGPSLAVTAAGANSALVFISGDWAAVDGTSRTYRQVNSANPTERTYARNASFYAMYLASYADAGAAGSKTVGLSAPTGQKYTIAVVEVLGRTTPDVTVARFVQ